MFRAASVRNIEVFAGVCTGSWGCEEKERKNSLGISYPDIEMLEKLSQMFEVGLDELL